MRLLESQADREGRLSRAIVSELTALLSKTAEDITLSLRQELMAHIDKVLEEQKQGFRHEIYHLKQTANVVARRSSGHGRRVKCLFLVHFIVSWDSLADIFAAMKAANDFEPIVASINRRFPDASSFTGEDKVHEGLQALGIEHIRLPMEDLFASLDIIKAIEPDIIFRQTPWDVDIQPAFSPHELSFARLCYVPYYGLQMVERHDRHTNGEDFHTDMPYHRACWRIFCEDEFVKQTFEHTAVLAGRNVVVTGHPKLKRLARLSQTESSWPIPAISGKRPYRIVWAPHYSMWKDWLNFSSFPMVMDDMLAWARRDVAIEFTFKPHPLLREAVQCPNSPVSSSTFQSFLEQWNALANTAFVEGGNYAPLFAASDAMITDGISFLAEYQIFEKPLIFIERPDHVPFNELGRLVAEGANRVATLEEAQKLIEAFRAGAADPRQAQRRAVAARLVPSQEPAQIILESIRNGFKEEPLAKLPKRAEFRWRSAVSACAGQAGAGLELATRSI